MWRGAFMCNEMVPNEVITNFTGLLTETIVHLSNYLEGIFPKLNNNWWNDAVIANLTPQQRQWAEQKGALTLAELDLASLLGVFSKNWYRLSNVKGKNSSDFLNYIKEMQSIRNRWAHLDGRGISYDDAYRDLDTLYRFSENIKASSTFLKKISKLKDDVLRLKLSKMHSDLCPDSKTKPDIKEKTIEHTSTPPSTNSETIPCPKSETSTFSAGTMVSLKSDPSQIGAILSVKQGSQEEMYEVLINNETRTLYASQITEFKKETGQSSLSLSEFHAHLTALQIKNPSLSTLYSLNSARIDFIPYQFRPVMKFIRADRPRLLIADEVGVGKTIEAGLIIRELQARRDINSILIICPRHLVMEGKWRLEMKRFEERFRHLDGKEASYCMNEADEGEQFASSLSWCTMKSQSAELLIIIVVFEPVACKLSWFAAFLNSVPACLIASPVCVCIAL